MEWSTSSAARPRVRSRQRPRLATWSSRWCGELGHPAVAQAYALFGQGRPQGVKPARTTPSGQTEIVLRFSRQDSPQAVLESCLRSYTLQAVFTRDLAAAQKDGLLSLTGLETPLDLAASVVETPSAVPGALLQRLLSARGQTGSVLVLDGVEHLLVGTGDQANVAATFVRELSVALDSTGLRP